MYKKVDKKLTVVYIVFLIFLFIRIRKQLNIAQPFSKWCQILYNIIIRYTATTMSPAFLFVFFIFHYFHESVPNNWYEKIMKFFSTKLHKINGYLFKLVVVVTNAVLSDCVVRDRTIFSLDCNLLESGLVLTAGLSSGLSGDSSIGLTLSFLLFFLLLFPLGLSYNEINVLQDFENIWWTCKYT